MLENQHYVYVQDDVIFYEEFKKNATMHLRRSKGSSGNVTVLWQVNIQSGNSKSVQIDPMAGEVEFSEGQWNSFIKIEIFFISEDVNGLIVSVSLVNITGGGSLGNFTTIKITNFSNNFDPEPSRNPTTLVIVLTVSATLLVALFTAGIIVCCRKR